MLISYFIFALSIIQESLLAPSGLTPTPFSMKAGGDGTSKSRSTSIGGGGLPSGLAAMMKEMDDCDRPACEDTVSALTAALGRVKTKKPSARDGGKGIGRGDPSTPSACPPTSGLLGKSSWNLVHSMVSAVGLAMD